MIAVALGLGAASLFMALASAARRAGLVATQPQPRPQPQPQPRPRPSPGPQPQPTGRTPEQAARDLLTLARLLLKSGKGAQLGSKGNPSPAVQSAQRDMGGLTADGIYGPATRERGKGLIGVDFPVRDATGGKRAIPTARAATQAIPARQAAPPEPIPAHAVTLAPESPLTPRSAAERMFTLASTAIRSGAAHTLGSKDAPSTPVRVLQAAMRGLVSDGIYGPATRVRGKELLGREFPAREGAARVPRRAPTAPAAPRSAPAPSPPRAAAPAPMLVSRTPGAARAPTAPAAPRNAPAPSPPRAAATAPAPVPAPEPTGRTPEQAARDLLTLARLLLKSDKGSQLGSKASPSPAVQSAQRDMGGLTADGIYGPATRARGKDLLGETFPARG